MKKYFLHDGNKQTGPFSIDELKTQNIQRDTPVWFEGLPDWTIANDIPELKESLFPNLPPIFKSVVSSEPVTHFSLPPEKETFSTGKKMLILGGILIVVIAVFLIYENNKSSVGDTSPSVTSPHNNSDVEIKKKTTEELRQELAEKEKNNFVDYLTGEVSLRNNFIGQKVITGHVTNTASIATFKDIQLTVTFFSKTGAELGSQKLVVYEVIPPKQTSDFKFKTFAPEQTETSTVKISDAKVVE